MVKTRMCFDCKKKLDWKAARESQYPLHYAAIEISEHEGRRVKRADIKALAECPKCLSVYYDI